jgi:membrane protease YdiL (CAAX protease family)
VKRVFVFVRPVLPEDPTQLVFLFGVVCLFIARYLRWSPWVVAHNATKPLLVFVALALYAIQFAGSAGYFVCFRPGGYPLRRLLWFVCLPALVGLVVLCASYVYIAALASGNISLRNLGSSLSILSELGPGFHYTLIGFILVAVFTSRVALGSASLPLALPVSSISQSDDGFSWNRLHILLWLLIVQVPLFWFSTLAVLAMVRAHVIDRFLNNLWLIPMLLHDFFFVMFIGLAVWITGKEAWKAVRRSVRLPQPEFFALAIAVPIGVELLVLLGEYLFAGARLAVHASGKLPLPQFAPYFGSLTAGLLLSELLPAFWEEVVFRGLLQPRFISRYGVLRGIFLVGVVFAAMHFEDDFSFRFADGAVLLQLGVRLLQCLAMSGVLGWLTLRTGSVLPAALAHGIYNSLAESPLGPRVANLAIFIHLSWGVLAYVLFRYWPVQAEVVQESGAVFAGNMTRRGAQPSEQLTPTNHPHGLHSRMLGILRRPLLGPVLFGLVYGGIPCGIIFSLLGSDVYTIALLHFTIGLTPLAIVVATLSPTLGVNRKWQHILWRASLTSFATCVPVPTIVCTELALHWGIWVVKDIPRMIAIFSLWAIAVTFPSWLLAFGYALFKNRRSRRVAQP